MKATWLALLLAAFTACRRDPEPPAQPHRTNEIHRAGRYRLMLERDTLLIFDTATAQAWALNSKVSTNWITLPNPLQK